MLVGHGWDLHQHSKDEKLILGGVEFDEDGFTGHSDGDIFCLLYTSPSPRDS